MQTRPYAYIFRVQYLGLRYHGWQIQHGVKTLQGTIEKSIRFILGHEDFTLLGASRTDSGVSCLNGAFELFLKHPLDLKTFIIEANETLPSDIRLLKGAEVSLEFNIIQDVSQKQYGYYFSLGEKPHPFLSGTLAYFGQHLDLESMRKGSLLFLGKHDFRRFCTHSKQTDDFIREIYHVEIVSSVANTPFYRHENSYVFRVKGDGFLMHQVRRMSAALMMVGKGEITLVEIEKALHSQKNKPLVPKAPANGLVLEEVNFRNQDF